MVYISVLVAEGSENCALVEIQLRLLLDNAVEIVTKSSLDIC